MRSVPKIWKRIAAALIGLAYAALYGFWTMFMTGGGHANFIWFFLFIFVGFWGLYFPLMAVLIVDLRSMLSRIIFGGLIAFNLMGSSLMIFDWVREPSYLMPGDFAKTFPSLGWKGLIFFGAIHFLPTIVFAIFLIVSMTRSKAESEDDKLINIQLP